MHPHPILKFFSGILSLLKTAKTSLTSLTKASPNLEFTLLQPKLPSNSSETLFCLRTSAHAVPYAWHELSLILYIIGSFSSFGSLFQSHLFLKILSGHAIQYFDFPYSAFSSFSVLDLFCLHANYYKLCKFYLSIMTIRFLRTPPSVFLAGNWIRYWADKWYRGKITYYKDL